MKHLEMYYSFIPWHKRKSAIYIDILVFKNTILQFCFKKIEWYDFVTIWRQTLKGEKGATMSCHDCRWNSLLLPFTFNENNIYKAF